MSGNVQGHRENRVSVWSMCTALSFKPKVTTYSSGTTWQTMDQYFSRHICVWGSIIPGFSWSLLKWPEVAKLPELSSYATIQCLKSKFPRNGQPDKVLTDNGPQFSRKESRDFSKEYSFVYVTSSPHFPQAIGQAERTVRRVKNMLRKAEDPYKAMLDYRNTYIEEIGLSPA